MEELIHTYHLHPVFVHFPVALFSTALIFEILSLVFRQEAFHRTAFFLFTAGAIAAGFAVLTGREEAEHLNLVSHPVFNMHQKFAYITMWSSWAALAAAFAVKLKAPQVFRPVFFLIVLGAAILVAITAFYGGHMVYDYGVGVTP